MHGGELEGEWRTKGKSPGKETFGASNEADQLLKSLKGKARELRGRQE